MSNFIERGYFDFEDKINKTKNQVVNGFYLKVNREIRNICFKLLNYTKNLTKKMNKE